MTLIGGFLMVRPELNFQRGLADLFDKSHMSYWKLGELLGPIHTTVSRWINHGAKPSDSHMSAVCRELSHLLSPSEWEELLLLGGFVLRDFPHTPQSGLQRRGEHVVFSPPTDGLDPEPLRGEYKTGGVRGAESP